MPTAPGQQMRQGIPCAWGKARKQWPGVVGKGGVAAFAHCMAWKKITRVSVSARANSTARHGIQDTTYLAQVCLAILGVWAMLGAGCGAPAWRQKGRVRKKPHTGGR